MLFDDEVLSLFTTDTSVIYYAKLRMRYVLVFQSIAAFYDIPSSALRAYGHSLEPALLTIFGTCVIRVVWVMLVCPVWPGFAHLMICYPVTWLITSVLVCLSYHFHTWNTLKAIFFLFFGRESARLWSGGVWRFPLERMTFSFGTYDVFLWEWAWLFFHVLFLRQKKRSTAVLQPC